MVRWWSEKSPGLKILWIWTLGTSVVVMTNVVTSRMRDMDKLLREEDAALSQSDPPAFSAASSQEQVIADE